MQKALVAGAVSALVTFWSFGASAMTPIAAPDTMTAPPLVEIAMGCGAGRYRGVGGYCQGHRVPTVKKVCTARRYPGGLVRRCHVYRM